MKAYVHVYLCSVCLLDDPKLEGEGLTDALDMKMQV